MPLNEHVKAFEDILIYCAIIQQLSFMYRSSDSGPRTPIAFGNEVEQTAA